MFSHIKPLLEQNGYEISVIYTERKVEVNRLVAEGQADLAFVNDVSCHIGGRAGSEIRSAADRFALTHRALLAFSRDASAAPRPVRKTFENKTIGEILNGECHGNLAELVQGTCCLWENRRKSGID